MSIDHFKQFIPSYIEIAMIRSHHIAIIQPVTINQQPSPPEAGGSLEAMSFSSAVDLGNRAVVNRSP